MSTEKPKISCLSNGPYYLSDDPALKTSVSINNSQGKPFSTDKNIALCRCGGSKNKPFCDGTHSKNGFSDKKLSNGKLNKRVNYPQVNNTGKKITIHDNREICAHAGYCTDNLSSVFKYKEEPWIDADAATVEDIINTIAKCPSGALSYSIDNTEHQIQTSAPLITVLENGPYAVTGGIELIDQKLGEGCTEERYTLCRCGASKNKPFCDGSHWTVDFKD